MVGGISHPWWYGLYAKNILKYNECTHQEAAEGTIPGLAHQCAAPFMAGNGPVLGSQ